MKRTLAATLVACLATSAPLARAAGWYAGIAAGESRTDSELVRNREDTLQFVSQVHTDFDATGSAWKVFGGYRLNDYVALEATYADLGRHRMASDVVGLDPSTTGSFTIRRSISGFGLDVVGGVPIGERLAVFARIGAFRAHVQSDVDLEGNIVFGDGTPDERSRRITGDDTVAHFGVGGEWSFSPELALRLEWERYAKVGDPYVVGDSHRTGEADTDAYLLGLVYRFR
jgi:OOP family OmpA-OmpF porin